MRVAPKEGDTFLSNFSQTLNTETKCIEDEDELPYMTNHLEVLQQPQKQTIFLFFI